MKEFCILVPLFFFTSACSVEVAEVRESKSVAHEVGDAAQVLFVTEGFISIMNLAYIDSSHEYFKSCKLRDLISGLDLDKGTEEKIDDLDLDGFSGLLSLMGHESPAGRQWKIDLRIDTGLVSGIKQDDR